ncbi:L-rhamnose-binding lectin ELEL-1-like [Saccoglossus kowalevskii]
MHDEEQCGDFAAGLEVFGVKPGVACFSGIDAAETYSKHGPVSGECTEFDRHVFAYIKRSVTCQKEMMNLECNYGKIRILSAVYGHGGDLDVCGNEVNGPIQCEFDVVDIVKDICEGKPTCSKNTVMKVYGNPCASEDGHQDKYLEVKYYCGQ